jgi:hypothetical protein
MDDNRTPVPRLRWVNRPQVCARLHDGTAVLQDHHVLQQLWVSRNGLYVEEWRDVPLEDESPSQGDQPK